MDDLAPGVTAAARQDRADGSDPPLVVDLDGSLVRTDTTLACILALVWRPLGMLPALLSLLEEIPCQGKRIHDAHLVATAIVHRLRTIVTLNGDDFEPFSSRVDAIEPARLLRGTGSS